MRSPNHLRERWFFPKRFLSWGFKTLFASVSSCEWKQLLVSLYSFPPAGLCRRTSDRRRSSWRRTFSTELFFRAHTRGQIYNPDSSMDLDFIYTKNSEAAEIAVYLHQEFMRGGDRILSTQRIPGLRGLFT